MHYLQSYSFGVTISTDDPWVEAIKHFVTMFSTGIAIRASSRLIQKKSLVKSSFIHNISDGNVIL